MLECRHCSQRFRDKSALEEHALAMHQLELGLQQLQDSRHKIRPQWQAQAAQETVPEGAGALAESGGTAPTPLRSPLSSWAPLLAAAAAGALLAVAASRRGAW